MRMRAGREGRHRDSEYNKRTEETRLRKRFLGVLETVVRDTRFQSRFGDRNTDRDDSDY